MINTRRLFIGMLAALVLLLAAGAAEAQGRRQHSPKIDRALEQALTTGASTQNVIITLKPGHRAQMRDLLLDHGDLVESEHASIDALVVKIHSSDVAELADRDEVAGLTLDTEVYAEGASRNGRSFASSRDVGRGPIADDSDSSAAVVTSTLRETLGLQRVATDWAPTGSSGVGVVIIDSGITPSANFNGRITGFYDFVKAGGESAAPYDDYGHGTHVAGLIGSSGALSDYEFQGIAPDVKLVVVKVLDGTGQGRTSDVIRALDFVVANKAKLNAQIINLSLGHPISSPAADDPLVQAVQKATAAGYIVMTSAGNRGVSDTTGLPGYGGVSSPCNAPSAICVGAANTQNTVTRGDDVVAPYSGRGPSWYDGFGKPDVVAPGHKIAADASTSSYLYRTLPTSRAKSKNGQPLLVLSGTSMGAGVATGVAALIVDAHNRNGFNRQKPLSANLVKALLQFSAIPVADADYLTQGTGQVNADGAMALADAIDTSVPVGEWWLAHGVQPSSEIGGQRDAWAQNIVWGDNVLSGNVVYTSNIVWGDNIVWGTNIVWGDSVVVKASNIVWGDNIIWGTDIVWGDRVLGQKIGAQIVGAANIVWGDLNRASIVWGTVYGHNILWGTWIGDVSAWATTSAENIVWGDNIIWGENIVWGQNIIWGDNIIWGESIDEGGF